MGLDHIKDNRKNNVLITRVPKKVYRPVVLTTMPIVGGITHSFNKDYTTITPDDTADKYDYNISIPNELIKRIAKNLIQSGYIKL